MFIASDIDRDEVIDEVYTIIDNLRTLLDAPLFVTQFWSNISCRATLYIYTLYQVHQYSILTCTQAFAGKSVPVITLMNGNKGKRALYQAILCSLRNVLLRAIHSPLSHPLSPSLMLSSSRCSISRPLGTKTVSFAITLWRTVRLTLK